MGDGAGAKTCLIGENAPGNALLHAQKEAAHNAAGDGGGLEGTLENGGEDRGNGLDSGNDDAKRQNHIQQSHQGHQLLADLADALDAADENQTYHQADDDADDETAGGNLGGGEQAEVQQRRVDGGGDGVDLGGVAGAEDGAHAEQGVGVGKDHPLFAQAVFNVVHGAAYQLPTLVPLPVENGQGHLEELGAHTQQGGDPHPEHGAGAADGNGAGYARNVARAHSGGKGGAHRLERGDGTVAGLFLLEHPADGAAQGIGELADLQKARAEAQVQSHADDAHHGGNAPDKAVENAVEFDKRFHNFSFFSMDTPGAGGGIAMP